MRLKHVCILLVPFIFFGCGEKKSEQIKEKTFTYSSFKEIVSLSSKKYLFDSISYPNKIHLKEGILLVSDLGGKRLIHLIRANSMKYIGGKGKTGSGPGEIEGGNVREFDLGFDSSTFWVYDLNSKRNYEFGIFDSLVLANKVVKQKGDFFFGFSMNWKGDNEIISYLSHDSHKFGIFDSTGIIQKKIRPWSFQKEVDPYEGYILSDIYQGPIDYRPEINHLVHASVRHETFDVLNLNFEEPKIFSITGPTGEPFLYEIKGSGNQMGAVIDPSVKLGYNDVFLGVDSIFLVYIGKTLEVLNLSGEISTTIFEFDLLGNPKNQYLLDRNIKSIVVDEERKIIYATTEDKDPGIAVFNY
jgi:hypothetical protein